MPVWFYRASFTAAIPTLRAPVVAPFRPRNDAISTRRGTLVRSVGRPARAVIPALDSASRRAAIHSRTSITLLIIDSFPISADGSALITKRPTCKLRNFIVIAKVPRLNAARRRAPVSVIRVPVVALLDPSDFLVATGLCVTRVVLKTRIYAGANPATLELAGGKNGGGVSE